jgi:hypothetical protein
MRKREKDSLEDQLSQLSQKKDAEIEKERKKNEEKINEI